MRIRDKILIENGYITKAKVKWYGIGTFAYPYLWKENKADTDYKKSWSDPRVTKAQKGDKRSEKRQNNINQNQRKNKGRKP
ncbi:hypothetical protein M2451_004181 [Dysgonomonas sp. PFB1-18]|uniref:hypothetical protein n=1 Tax=unclassified Dysgonomonas TaxID=2630389 RepID=UPI0024745670|nr:MULTISPECIES: hypothetical protein [unclassified Dysgonomonas]MDH6311238.1 hypothetical protein [Dysgonomonas sp. PF1-14]MDH6341136.1 hypothetical protein [Dysgonomonas sp. PF1-16]MDH6382826.1 hypothetical protein [Dysgonomonas sp. PFB1-18]MDH6400108.1 hypothetical protein [Dysgonomonas sp. PF1-23]